MTMTVVCVGRFRAEWSRKSCTAFLQKYPQYNFKKMGRRHKMHVFSVLITVMLLACISLDVSW